MLKSIKSDRLFSKGQRLAQRECFTEAINLFEQAASLNPSHDGIYLHLGLAQSSEGKYEQAVASIRRAIQLKPVNPVYQAFLGLVHFDHQNYAAAIDASEQALAIDPNYSLPAFLKALTLFTQEDVKTAYPELAKHANNLSSSYQGRLLLQCESYLFKHRKASDSTKEIDIYIEKSELNPAVIPLHRNFLKASYPIANLLSELNFDRSDVVVRKHFLNGNLQSRLGNFDDAIMEYRKVLELDERFDKAREKLVEVLFEKRDFENALKYALELEEEDRRSQKKSDSGGEVVLISPYSLILGALYTYLGQYGQAETYLAAAIKNDPLNYLTYYFLGVCRLVQGDEKSALHYFKKSLSFMNPKLALARLNAANEISLSL